MALHRGVAGLPSSLGLDETVEVTTVETSKLSDSVSKRLEAGLTFGSKQEARAVIEDYRSQIEHASEEQGTKQPKAPKTEGTQAGSTEQDQPASPEGA